MQVGDEEIIAVMRIHYEDTHQLVEGAGACPLAALLQECDAMRGRKVGLVLSGGNIDRPLYAKIIGKDVASSDVASSNANE